MHYYFHVCTVGEMVRDKVGREFGDIRSAERFARRYADLLQSKPAYRRIAFRVIEIRSEAGRLVATIPFSSFERGGPHRHIHGEARSAAVISGTSRPVA